MLSHVELEHHNQVQATKGSDGYGSNYTIGHALDQGYLRDLDDLQDN
jgi:transketolase